MFYAASAAAYRNASQVGPVAPLRWDRGRPRAHSGATGDDRGPGSTLVRALKSSPCPPNSVPRFPVPTWFSADLISTPAGRLASFHALVFNPALAGSSDVPTILMIASSRLIPRSRATSRLLALACLAVLAVNFMLAANRASAAKPTVARPNIIFLLADDLGYGDIGAYGQKKIRTPHLDRLAQDGMRFTQHYSGHNVCAPSRCVLMTGLHPGHAYIRNNRGGVGQASGKGIEGQEPVHGGQQCVRVGDWKAIRTNLHPGPRAKNQKPGAIELYNLAADPSESRDVAAQHPKIVAQLAAIMKEQHVPTKLWPIRALDTSASEQ